MPGPYETILARVQQKVATEADWLAVETDLGVIFAGEQAFVVDDSGTGVNFKIGDGTKLFSELPYFIQYNAFTSNVKRLSFINANIDQTIANVFKNYTCLYDIIFINTSGSIIDLKVGTTSGGNEIMEVGIDPGASPISLRKVFQAATTVYFSGLAGNTYSMFLIYYQYDENPAFTSGTGSGTGGFRWPRCSKGMFEPLTDTDLNNNWDFTTGKGIAGTVWENCAISGTQGTEDMGRFYPVGFEIGTDSLRPATTFGNSSGGVSLTNANLPKTKLSLFSINLGSGTDLSSNGLGAVPWASNKDIKRDYAMQSVTDDEPTLGHTSSFGQAVPDLIDVRPKSKVILFWVAIED